MGGAYSELNSQLATQKRQMQPSAPIGIEFWAIRSPRSHKQQLLGRAESGRRSSSSSSHREKRNKKKKKKELEKSPLHVLLFLALSRLYPANERPTVGTNTQIPPPVCLGVGVSRCDGIGAWYRRCTSGDSTQKSVSCWAVSVQVHRRSARAAANSSVLNNQDASFSDPKKKKNI